jgi:hypothetical protein
MRSIQCVGARHTSETQRGVSVVIHNHGGKFPEHRRTSDHAPVRLNRVRLVPKTAATFELII